MSLHELGRKRHYKSGGPLIDHESPAESVPRTTAQRRQPLPSSSLVLQGIREPFRRLIVEARPRTPIAALNHGKLIPF
jgi:hypothetical protein